ncbi:hypothetical protein OQH60_04520 [Campylobacter sp. MIT 21-1685]|uniref:hypothetical protein n=1 Tax=unclassified Campylobacter TaxID=2593542 RepID=UPI00224A6518|nr:MULTISPECIES: hypothetical protein [unclassified Campylobacter]MCX2683132.1 hypothetical protein [Campylobacter sp. MIT 21-1684]MCX2751408.1 hypothetical protein [Campylobacter sp. MIT 21-1682]MCX2807608.1 hypothetical protein [Campylobacter sp. MIT 21-1685]
MSRKKTQARFISFDKLHYILKTKTSEDMFLETAKELNLKEPFKYQMSFAEYEGFYHCFFAEFTHIGKEGFCYPQPLIFQALADEKLINEKNFCVVVFNEKFSLLCLYHNAKLSKVKNIPTLTLLTVHSQDEQRFAEILQQARIIELLQYHQIQLLLSFNDTVHFTTFLGKQTGIKYVQLEQILGNNALEELSQKSIKYLDENANFIKQYKRTFPLYLKLFILFISCFCLTLFSLTMLELPRYQQNKIIKAENENLNNELVLLEQKTQKLLKEFKDLNHTLYTESLLLEQNIQIFNAIFETLKPNQNKTFLLYKLFTLLNANKITISLLRFEDSKLTLFLNTQENWRNAYMLFSQNSEFKLLEHDELSYTLVLGYDNE